MNKALCKPFTARSHSFTESESVEWSAVILHKAEPEFEPRICMPVCVRRSDSRRGVCEIAGVAARGTSRKTFQGEG